MPNQRFLPVLVLAILPAMAGAAPVAILNAGFEDLYLGSNLPAIHGGDVPPGAFPVGPAPAGWAVYDPDGVVGSGASVGVLNPGTLAAHGTTFFPGGAPEGDNAALLYFNGGGGGSPFGIEQQLAATLQANTAYTLTVEIGNIATGTGLGDPFASFGEFNLDGFPGYQVQLLAGGTLLAQDDSSLTPGEGLFATSTLPFTTDATPAELGQALTIRLINLNNPDAPGVTGLEVDFDHARLDATVLAAVPLPPSLFSLLCALPAIFLIRRRHLPARG